MTTALKNTAWFRIATVCFFLFSFAGGAAANGAPYSLCGGFFRSGDTLYLAVIAQPETAGVYLYAGKSVTTGGKPTEIAVAVEGASLEGRAFFPQGTAKADPWLSGALAQIYEGPVTIYVPLPEDAAGKALSVKVTGLACSAVNCTPVTLYHDFTVPPLNDAAAKELPENLVPEDMPRFTDTRSLTDEPPFGAGGGQSFGQGYGQTAGVLGGGKTVPIPGAFLTKITPAPFAAHLEVSSLGKAVLLGFFAGLILNLMPCVLPVIGIKLAALFRAPGTQEERIRSFRRHQIFFACGIFAWFACLAALLSRLDLAWGQIFQSPIVVSLLALVLVLLALSLFGVFHLPLIDLKAERTKNPHLRAFFEGFTATLIATPCGGPLLGGVLSWTLMQPAGVMSVALGSVGLGMASPYLLLAAFPALSRRLPRPGPWMGALEQALGFLLLTAAAYFMSFLPFGIPFKIAAAATLVLFGLWRWKRRSAAKLFGAACIALSCYWLLQPAVSGMSSAVPGSGGANWREYSHTAFEELLGSRRVLIDFTADWCPTCKMVEATALRESNREAWAKEYGLVFMRVDLTHDNPEGAALLKAVGSASIPVIAVFGKGESAFSPLVLRDVVTGGQVKEALDRAVARE
ncbi:MAG: Thiol:disulfide interchange protein DsbD [Desulfovibrio sp.]